ncbi:MAG: hypothetical protein ACE5GN_07410 [Waddliaceae bacterium]
MRPTTPDIIHPILMKQNQLIANSQYPDAKSLPEPFEFPVPHLSSLSILVNENRDVMIDLLTLERHSCFTAVQILPTGVIIPILPLGKIDFETDPYNEKITRF